MLGVRNLPVSLLLLSVWSELLISSLRGAATVSHCVGCRVCPLTWESPLPNGCVIFWICIELI